MIADWLKWWHPDKETHTSMYPETGLVAQCPETGAPIYAGFIWLTNSSVAQMGFIVRNPNYRNRSIAQQTRKTFLADLCLYAKALGYEFVLTWTENAQMIRDMKAVGFTATSERCTELIIKL